MKFLKLLSLAFVLAFLFATTSHAEFNEDALKAELAKNGQTVFPIGKDNVNYEKYFTGKSFLAPLAKGHGINVSNVTFKPGTINHWHIHKKSCQVLVGVYGQGWYQIWGEKPVKMVPGVTVTIPEGVKHWHGAAQDGWFQHLSIMLEGAQTDWLEPVDPKSYQDLK